MWDEKAAERYEAWYHSPRGAFALAREQRLLADVVSPWQRRNQTLLEIGCGAGHFLELFYAGGFDVTGIDKSQPMLEKARERMGYKATLRIGDAGHLPFDDGEFDYVAMVTSLECMEDPEAALAEAFRVATRGVVIAYLNAWSLYNLEQKLRTVWNGMRRKQAGGNGEPVSEPQRKRTLQQARWFDLFRISRMIRRVSGKYPNVFRSTLFSPSLMWRGVRPFSLSWAHLLPFGAVSVVRVDLLPVCATPIVIKPRNVGRGARAHAGIVTMDRYPHVKEKQ